MKKESWLVPPEYWVLFGLAVITPTLVRILGGCRCRSSEHTGDEPTGPRPRPSESKPTRPGTWWTAPNWIPPASATATDEDIEALRKEIGDPFAFPECTPEAMEALRELLRERPW